MCLSSLLISVFVILSMQKKNHYKNWSRFFPISHSIVLTVLDKMLSTVSFLVLLSIGLIHTTPIVEESCEAELYNRTAPCNGLIWVTKPCKEATAHLATTSFKSCDVVALIWAYPINNLTVIIETPFTQQHQPYAIHINNKQIRSSDFSLYRILNGHETKIKSIEDIIVQQSDSNYQVILKVQAETIESLYILPINYNVTKS